MELGICRKALNTGSLRNIKLQEELYFSWEKPQVERIKCLALGDVLEVIPVRIKIYLKG